MGEQRSASEASPGSSGCLSVDALEPYLRGTPDAAVAAHLERCPACRGRIEEMRAANLFLARFGSEEGSAIGRRSDGAVPRVGAIRAAGYDIEELVAFGGQGAVYRARQKGTGRTVAIKVPLGDTLHRPAARYRFKREIELTARLDHPGIVAVLGDCELDDGRLACVMEFVAGEPFDRWAAGVRPDGRAGVRRIVEIMCDVADAIAYAHQRAVMHRDIKPSNVLVAGGGAVHVLDFGLAKSLDESGETFATLTGAFVGTLAYAAPEQISGARDAVDLRTDVYALGLLLYQALTGRLPHEADLPAAELFAHIREIAAARPSSISPDVNNDLDAVVLMALAKEKERRYASGAEFRDDLRAWLDGRAVRARFDSGWYMLRKAVRRHRWPVLATAIGAIALIAMGGLALTAWDQSTRARLSDAVGDARTLESHRVRMSEARSLAQDSFALGEQAAWNALLDPEAILVEQGIEGTDASGPAAASPAYWALWEMYMRTPVVASLPERTSSSLMAGSAPDELLTVGRRGVTWWNWRLRRAERHEDPSGGSGVLVVRGSPDARTIGVLTGDRELFLSRDDGATWTQVGQDRTFRQFVPGTDRLAALTFPDEPTPCFEIWDLSVAQPRVLASIPFVDVRSHSRGMTTDGSGRFFAVANEAGELLVVEGATGRVLLRRLPNEEPRLDAVHSRGGANEFLATGPVGAATIRIGPDGSPTISHVDRKVGVMDYLSLMLGQTAGGRYLYLSDRQQMGIGRLASPPTEGTVVPSLATSNATLLDEGQHAAVSLFGSGRCVVLDLEPAAIRRLPFPADISPGGFATIFDLQFSEDSAWLFTAAMDGSIRRFASADARWEFVATKTPVGGASAIGIVGDALLVGGHHVANQTAELLMLGAGAAPQRLYGADRRFCGIVAGPGDTAWALTGGGLLLEIEMPAGRIIRETDLSTLAQVSFRALAPMPPGRLLVAASHMIVLVEPGPSGVTATTVATGAFRRAAALPSTLDQFATCGDDGVIRLWRVTPTHPPAAELIREFGAHAGPAFSLSMHPDGRLIASGGGGPESKDVRIWDSQTGYELASLNLFDIGIFDLEFSPDGRWLAAGGEVRLSHPEEGGQLFLIDLLAPDAAIAGNLEYHAARLSEELGRDARQVGGLREWAARRAGAPSAAPSP